MVLTVAGEQTDEGPLERAVPPGGHALVAQWVLDDLAQLAGLRTGLATQIDTTWTSSMAETADKVVLIASELATNALHHGLPPTVVQLLKAADSWLLDVADHDLRSAPSVGEREPGEGGLGLQIAQRLALEVGWYATGTTKHVWALLPRE
ncbi:ATP-binding protein [Isoptericola sp. NPDC057653]|uniref:ATP-binding protein n=1 Tax=Isoptericola sp. NPDC057653 TaxID=3346195 RepID=UPI0036B0055C